MPSTHLVHAVKPTALEKEPATQLTQVALDVAAEVSEYVPMRHTTHVDKAA